MRTAAQRWTTTATACRTPEINALVDLWGAVMDTTPQRPVVPTDLTDQLSAAVLGIFGNEDTNPSPEVVNTREATLKAAGKDYEYWRYDNAGHGFMHSDQPSYRQEQAIDAWDRVWGFFEQRLSS